MRRVSIGGPLNQNAADSSAAERLARSAMSSVNAGAKASMVNRTHRVVRERARAMHNDRNRLRGLMLPLALCSVLMVLLYAACWMVAEQYEAFTTDNIVDGHRPFLILLWFLPVSVALIAMVWVGRSRNQSDTEAIR